MAGERTRLIRQAAEIGLLTTPYAFNPDEAAAMAKAGFREQVAGMDAAPGSFPTS